MAIVNYVEILPRTFSHKLGESPTAERKYAVTVDAPESHQTILDTIGIYHGSTHPEFGYLLCTDGSISETDRFHAEVTYRYEVPKQEDWDPNPLSRPDVWSFSTGGGTVPFLSYYHGDGNSDVRPLVNAANDYIEGLTVLAPEVKATISGNRASFPLSLAAEVTNAINSSPYLGGAAFTWQCTGISAQQAVEVVNDIKVYYWQVTAELAYRKGGYIEKVPHVGFHYVQGGKKYRAWVYSGKEGDSEKVDATTPQPLTESGDLKYPGGDGRPDQLNRRPYPAINFSSYFGTPPF
jgi:hypothetical protein